jgi:tetratricopeptide (TPR) repeat protein
VEFILRVVGYGYPPAATIKCKVNGTAAYGDNVKFAWRFFPREIARDFEPFILPADKGRETCRIFILGSSAAQGIPDAAFNFGRILRVMLQESYTGVDFEVVTVAMAAINTHVVLQAAKDCARHQADVYVVYLGNNEVTGPYGAGTVFTPLSGNLFLIRSSIALKTSKLAQLLANLGEWVGARRDIPRVWGGMEMFLEKQVSADDPSLQKVYRHFRANLQDISRAARVSGAKVILCTVASNVRDCPPFGSLHRPDFNEKDKQEWQDIYQQGVAYEAASDYGRAVERYLAAGKIDDRYADLQFRLGRCYCNLGEYDQARDRFIRARELDTLRFRADNRINQVVRDVASSRVVEGVYLADAVRAFEDNSPHGIPGEELFYEHVHLNFKGNYLLAKTVFEQLEQALPQWVRTRRTPERPLATEQQCAERLAYTDWDRYRIADEVLTGFIMRAPFTNQLYHKEQVEAMQRELEQLKASMTRDTLEESARRYRRAIELDGSDWVLHWKYGKLLAEDLKDYKSAVEQYRLVQNLLPHSYLGYNALGSVLCALWDLDGAIGQHLKAIRIRPTCSDAHYHLGWAYEEKGQINKAIRHYAQSARWRRDHVPAYNNLAEILTKQGRIDKAIEVCREGLRYSPNSAILHCNLGALFAKQGRRDQALMEIQTALQIDPNSAMIRRVLEAVSGKGD